MGKLPNKKVIDDYYKHRAKGFSIKESDEFSLRKRKRKSMSTPFGIAKSRFKY